MEERPHDITEKSQEHYLQKDEIDTCCLDDPFASPDDQRVIAMESFLVGFLIW